VGGKALRTLPHRSHPGRRPGIQYARRCERIAGAAKGPPSPVWGEGLEGEGAGISGGRFGGSGGDGVAGAAGYWIPDQVRDDVVCMGGTADFTPPESSRAKTRDPVCSEVREDCERCDRPPSPVWGEGEQAAVVEERLHRPLSDFGGLFAGGPVVTQPFTDADGDGAVDDVDEVVGVGFAA